MSQVTNDAFNHYVPEAPVTCSNTYGQIAKEATVQGGSMMFDVGGWLGKAKLSGITVVHTILFSFCLALIVGLFFGVLITRNNPKTFSFQGVRYEIVGVGEIQDGDKKIYSPVYEVKK